MDPSKITPQYVAATVILLFTNALILFGLDIGAKRESALEVIVNTVAVVGFLAYGAVKAHAHAKVSVAKVQAGLAP